MLMLPRSNDPGFFAKYFAFRRQEVGPIEVQCDHVAHGWDEIALSDCQHGCKVMRCGCGATFVSHSRTYGCRADTAV